MIFVCYGCNLSSVRKIYSERRLTDSTPPAYEEYLKFIDDLNASWTVHLLTPPASTIDAKEYPAQKPFPIQKVLLATAMILERFKSYIPSIETILL